MGAGGGGEWVGGGGGGGPPIAKEMPDIDIVEVYTNSTYFSHLVGRLGIYLNGGVRRVVCNFFALPPSGARIGEEAVLAGRRIWRMDVEGDSVISRIKKIAERLIFLTL